MATLFDIGANLTNRSFREDVDAVIERAFSAGVSSIAVTGTSLPATRDAIALARRYPGRLWATAGMHPHHAHQFTPDVLSELEELAGASEVVAVGECGLDYNRHYSSREDQVRCFEAQLGLASKLGLPIFLHERDAHEAFVEVLERHQAGRPPAVVHCFTAGEKALERYLEMGLYVGITGWICDERRGGHLKELVRRVPADRLLLETDAPFLLPRDLRGAPRNRRNEPAFLPHVASTIARCRGESLEAVAAATTANAERFFGVRGRSEAC